MTKYFSLFVVLFVSLTSVSHAALISLGTGDTTLDTATGRLWLDVNLTTNCHYGVFTGNFVCNGIDTSQWTFATRADVEQLWTNAGISLTNTTTYTALNTPETVAFQSLFGITVVNDPLAGTNGFVSSASALLAQLFVDASTNTSRDVFFSASSMPSTGVGAYLYQEAGGDQSIPSPAVSWLLLPGLCWSWMRGGRGAGRVFRV